MSPEPSPTPTAADIYEAYPRKVGRRAAIAAIEKAISRLYKYCPHDMPAPQNQLLNATAQFARATLKWPMDEQRFIPHPATWFNQDRFLDDPKEWVRGQVGTVQNKPKALLR